MTLPEWKDRRVERENTYKVLNNKDGTITLMPVTGEIYEPGTPLNALNLNKINSQLSEKANKNDVNNKLIEKMDKNTTDISITQINRNKGKIDQTYLAEELLQQIVGNTPINAVPANKSITKMKLASKAVTENETSFLEINRVNMFNKLAVTDRGKVIRDTDGVLVNNEIGCVSEYIEVNAGETIRCTLNWTGAFYNNNLEFITGKEFGITEFIVPQQAKFYRQSISISKLDSLMLTIDKDLPTKYVDYYDYNVTLNKALQDAVRKVASMQLVEEKWGAVGDSLTEKNITAKENYTDFVSRDLGLSCVNFGLGGSGYMRKYETNEAFYQRVNNLPLDLGVITIFGSGNDLALYSKLGDVNDAGTDTICGCINKTIDNLLVRFPTTPIGIIAPTPWAGNTPNISNSKMESYVLKLEQICKKRGIPFLDLYHHSNLHPDNDACLNLTFYNKSAVDGNGDGVHPNDLGHKIITPIIRGFIKNLL